MHEVICCGNGEASLRRALAEIDADGKEVVAIVHDTGGNFLSALGSGRSYGLLIVVRSR